MTASQETGPRRITDRRLGVRMRPERTALFFCVSLQPLSLSPVRRHTQGAAGAKEKSESLSFNDFIGTDGVFFRHGPGRRWA